MYSAAGYSGTVQTANTYLCQSPAVAPVAKSAPRPALDCHRRLTASMLPTLLLTTHLCAATVLTYRRDMQPCRNVILERATAHPPANGVTPALGKDDMARTVPYAIPAAHASLAGTRHDGAEQSLCIALLGGFQITLAGYSVDIASWRLAKARSLVKLLALAPGYCLSRDQILDLLWPDLGAEAAANNFYQALHAARQALARQGQTCPPAALLPLQRQVLTLHTAGSLWVDVGAFEAAAMTAHRTRDLADYAAALALYTGELLPEDRYEDWAAGRREALHETFLALLVGAARQQEARGDYPAAAALLVRFLAAEPAREEAHVGLMRLYALQGQRAQALRQYAHLRTLLRQELDVEPDTASQQLYHEILARQFPVGVAPATPPPPAGARHNVPASPTSFVGRTRELAEVTRLLDTVRLLTLSGAGGCGKTRLALAVAARVLAAATYPGGVWLVELAALTEPALVPRVVAAALGVREEPGRSLSATLSVALRATPTLLILDNCEHLGAACAALVGTLLGACPQLRVLATSRERLHLPGELTWPVPPLALPEVDYSLSLEALARCEAVQLFLARAQLVQPDFTLTSQNATAVVEICRRVEGIPLALELAALRVPVLAVEQLAARLGDALRVLTGGDRTVAPRQQTLRATLDWSYGLLAASERRLLRRLAIFAGGWTVEAAEAIGRADDPAAETVLDLLAHLAEKSLVLVEVHGDAVRYRMLETVRQYSEAQLRSAPEEIAPACARHAAYYLALAEQAEPALTGREQDVWLVRLEREHDNLRAALRWLLEAGQAELGLRLGGRLWRFWQTKGYFAEGRRWLAALLDQAGAVARSMERAKVLFGAGRLAYVQGDYPPARALLAESLTIARDWDDRELIAGALIQLGHLAFVQGDTAEARARYEESLATGRVGGWDHSEWAIGIALTSLGKVAFGQDDAASGQRLYEQALAIFRQLGDTINIADARAYLGQMAFARGDLPAARARYTESLALRRAVGNRPGIANALAQLGCIATAQNDYALAGGLFTESLPLLQVTGATQDIAACLEGCAVLALALRQPAPALCLAGAAATLRVGGGGFSSPAVGRQTPLTSSLTPAWQLAGEAAAAAWATGQTLPLAQAIAEALRVAALPAVPGAGP
jgi:predicted ATPase/DNA-binding SARP family transcriptional activator